MDSQYAEKGFRRKLTLGLLHSGLRQKSTIASAIGSVAGLKIEVMKSSLVSCQLSGCLLETKRQNKITTWPRRVALNVFRWLVKLTDGYPQAGRQQWSTGKSSS